MDTRLNLQQVTSDVGGLK